MTRYVVLCYNSNFRNIDDNLQAKKRQLIDQRLQAKLRKESDSVRRAEEAKKDKTIANRREEELQVKDSIVSAIPLTFNYVNSRIISTNFVGQGYVYSPTFS